MCYRTILEHKPIWGKLAPILIAQGKFVVEQIDFIQSIWYRIVECLELEGTSKMI